MARTHTFKGSASAGYGYFAYIEDGQLVIGEDWGRDGGIIYKGPYQHAQIIMSRLRANAPKLANSIDKYYFEEAQRVAAMKEPYYVRYRFKDSRDRSGNGYSGYINTDGLLIIEQDDPRGGGVRFEGKYEEASPVLAKLLLELRAHDPVLYDDINKYYTKHDPDCVRVTNSNPAPDMEELKKKYSFDEETKTIMFKVKIYNKNGQVHNCLVRGRFQADVIKKLMPQVPEVLTIQTVNADVFAIRSSEISAVEFVED